MPRLIVVEKHNSKETFYDTCLPQLLTTNTLAPTQNVEINNKKSMFNEGKEE